MQLCHSREQIMLSIAWPEKLALDRVKYTPYTDCHDMWRRVRIVP